MLAKFFCFFASLFSLGQTTEAVVAFLDKEQRPGAQIVTESFVDFAQVEDVLVVEGVLGAIRSDRKPGAFVAFSGVDLGGSAFEINKEATGLEFDLNKVEGIEVLTVQLVLKGRNLFATDLLVNKDKEKYKLQLSDFRESFRGRLGEMKFSSQLDDIESVRFFLKRSENRPGSSEPLDFSFSLSNLNFFK